jgi:hypothetical protein
MLRRIEFMSGLATSVFGLLGWAYAALGPTSRYVGSAISSNGRTTTVSGSSSVVQRGLEPRGVVFFAIVLLVVVSFAAVAYWHSQRRGKAALMILWAITSLLWISVVLGAASIGVLLFPAALLAMITAVTGSLEGRS